MIIDDILNEISKEKKTEKKTELNTIYERIEYLSRQQKISRKQLCILSGISSKTISLWKTGRIPATKNLLKIANILGTSIEYLLTGEEKFVENYKKTKDQTLFFLSQYNRLSTNDKKYINNMVEALIDCNYYSSI